MSEFIKIRIDSAADTAGFDQAETGLKKIEAATKKLKDEEADRAAKWEKSPINPKNAPAAQTPAAADGAGASSGGLVTAAIIQQAWMGIDRAIDNAIKTMDEARIATVRQSAELEKQINLWRQMGAAASSEKDVRKLAANMREQIDQMKAKMEEAPSHFGFLDKLKEAKNWLDEHGANPFPVAFGDHLETTDERLQKEGKARIEQMESDAKHIREQTQKQENDIKSIGAEDPDKAVDDFSAKIDALKGKQAKVDPDGQMWIELENQIEAYTAGLKKAERASEEFWAAQDRIAAKKTAADERGAARAEKDFAADMAKIDRKVDAEEKKAAEVAKILRDEQEEHAIQVALLAGNKELAAELSRQKTLHDQIDKLVKAGVPVEEATVQANITAELNKQIAAKNTLNAMQDVKDADAVAAAGTHHSRKAQRDAKETQFRHGRERALKDAGFEGEELKRTLAGEMETYREENKGHRIGGTTRYAGGDHAGGGMHGGAGLTKPSDWRNLFKHGIGPHVPESAGGPADFRGASPHSAPAAAGGSSTEALGRAAKSADGADKALSKEADKMKTSLDSMKTTADSTFSQMKTTLNTIQQAFTDLQGKLSQLDSQFSNSRTP